ncbi:hypothetical protein TetV_118 [Tetraselmis virus 1]|uniref:NET domain-containing protein n=1 Tax=Tetraselmis virus 1 TaxID=2060617 RepID=A0A2P0VMV1_9VIRU|nr:hypothetical protein QJ968_gp118 [Tetraselmis virus 1]AUF82210.1 hypothetical protein TetV_118 [Tetraselmis virus 1]
MSVEVYEMNDVDSINEISRRKKLADKVSEMGSTEHEQILRIIHSNGIRYTRNNNGVFCDITKVPENVLNNIEQFILFSERSAEMLEQKREIAPAEEKEDTENIKEETKPQKTSVVRTERVKTFVNSMTKARTESTTAKRKETCRYQQLRKKYSRPVACKTNYTYELQPE